MICQFYNSYWGGFCELGLDDCIGDEYNPIACEVWQEEDRSGDQAKEVSPTT
jgi:hypothetical protein